MYFISFLYLRSPLNADSCIVQYILCDIIFYFYYHNKLAVLMGLGIVRDMDLTLFYPLFVLFTLCRLFVAWMEQG